MTYRDAGDIEDAKRAIQKSYYINPDDEEVIETLATICYETSDISGAFEYTAIGLSMNPDNFRLLNTLGVLYFNQEDYASASEAFEGALSINPYYYDALYNLRDCYDELGNGVGVAICTEKIKELSGRN